MLGLQPFGRQGSHRQVSLVRPRAKAWVLQIFKPNRTQDNGVVDCTRAPSLPTWEKKAGWGCAPVQRDFHFCAVVSCLQPKQTFSFGVHISLPFFFKCYSCRGFLLGRPFLHFLYCLRSVPFPPFCSRSVSFSGRWTREKKCPWSLCNAGTLITEDDTIPSTRGVQQGDLLGPFLFAVGLHQVLKDLPADIINNYYLDDGLHHGTLTAPDKLLGLLPKLHAIDLSLNVAKCHIFTRGDTSLFSNLREVPVSADGFEFLGAPVGTAQYVHDLLTTKFGKAIAFCGQVARLNDPQINLLLQRCADVCRVLHLLKVIPPDVIHPFCQRLDAELLGSHELSTGINLSPQSRRQVVLPTRHRGFGLRANARLSAPSFVTSILRFRSAGIVLLNAQSLMSPSPAGSRGRSSTSPGGFATKRWLWASDQASLNSSNFHPDFCSLRWWTEHIHRHDKENLWDQSSGSRSL